MKRKELTLDYLRDGWLKYHNTTSAEVVEKHPELCKTPDWFKLYKVSQAQLDEWHEWMINEIAKYKRCSKKFAREHSWLIYLDIAPTINEDKP